MNAATLWLALCAAQAGAAPVLRPLDAPGLEAPVLALELLSEDELVALSPDAVSLYRRRGPRLRLAARRRVEVEGPAVRSPAGLLHLEPGSRSVWALASGWEKALLIELDEPLRIRSEADALPWAGAPGGVRFRPGTSLIEGELAGLGSGPFLHLARGAALDAEGRLRREGRTTASIAVGTPLVRLPSGALLAGSPAPPGATDALLRVPDAGLGIQPVLETLPGSLRAASARLEGGRVALVLAIDTGSGSRLFALELGRLR